MEFCDISQHMGCTDVIYFYWNLKNKVTAFALVLQSEIIDEENTWLHVEEVLRHVLLGC